MFLDKHINTVCIIDFNKNLNVSETLSVRYFKGMTLTDFSYKSFVLTIFKSVKSTFHISGLYLREKDPLSSHVS